MDQNDLGFAARLSIAVYDTNRNGRSGMMQSISHWGQFEMQAAGTENFKEQIRRQINSVLAAKNPRPTSFFVSRQDKPDDAGAK